MTACKVQDLQTPCPNNLTGIPRHKSAGAVLYSVRSNSFQNSRMALPQASGFT